LPCESEAGIWATNALREDRQLTQSCDRPDSCHQEVWAWSPQGATLAVYEGGDVSKLFTIDPQTGDRTTLATPDVDVSTIAWSPDGASVVYAATGLQSVDLGSGETTRLTDLVGDVDSIGWSPDGTRLVLDDFLAGRNRILVMNADGSDQRVLVDQGAPQGPGAPAWSPDGTRIAYVSTPGSVGPNSGHFSFEVWVIGADGSAPTRLFHGKCCIGDWDGPVWSPDGGRIAFFDDIDVDYGTWLVVNADGTGGPTEIDELEVKRWRSSP
jgi:Tol biopolymer transport system component